MSHGVCLLIDYHKNMGENLVIRKVTQTEFWVGPTHVSVTNGNLLDIRAVGPQNYDTAMAHVAIFNQIYNEIKKPIIFLVDLNHAGKNSAEARKVWKDISDSEFTCKIALIGIHPVARVIAGFVMSISSSSKMQFFSTREKALEWIYEGGTSERNHQEIFIENKSPEK
jgi:hypothetical protein